jgi:hypothetical protein
MVDQEVVWLGVGKPRLELSRDQRRFLPRSGSVDVHAHSSCDQG